MAANEYYNTAYNNHPAYRPSNDAYNDQHPLSRYNSHTTGPVSPLPSTPYEDRPLPQAPDDGRAYQIPHQQPAPPYSGPGAHANQDADPYDDENAIPMSGRRKHDSTTTLQPILQRNEDVEDPFVRDADPNKPRRRGGRGGPPQRDGWFSGRITWVVYTLTLVQVIVFIAEIIKNAVLTKSPIEIHPSFNPMIGPSPYVLINMGSRYQPCMHNMPGVQNESTSISWPCPNATATTGASVSCSLSDLCGNGGVPNPHVGGSIHDTPFPNQWWRFIVPIFLHAGIIHIGFNLLLQMTLGRDVERLIGSIRFFIVYFASGIFGFVLGGNFAATGIASCGCSGSLFGILAITLLDLLYTWNQRTGPIKDLLFILVDVAIAFVLGLLPGLDNFSHIGGFLMGLVLGVCLLRSPTQFSNRPAYIGDNAVRYSGISRPSVSSNREEGFMGFIKNPLGFFQGRKGVWWAWWLVRVAALVGVLVGFILLLKNFYVWRTGCHWCKYLSCLDVTVGGENWCDVGNLNFTTTTTSSNGTSKRDLFRMDTFNPFENLHLI
jgi:membrane associated rhomboid family serine protease